MSPLVGCIGCRVISWVWIMQNDVLLIMTWTFIDQSAIKPLKDKSIFTQWFSPYLTVMNIRKQSEPLLLCRKSWLIPNKATISWLLHYRAHPHTQIYLRLHMIQSTCIPYHNSLIPCGYWVSRGKANISCAENLTIKALLVFDGTRWWGPGTGDLEPFLLAYRQDFEEKT